MKIDDACHSLTRYEFSEEQLLSLFGIVAAGFVEVGTTSAGGYLQEQTFFHKSGSHLELNLSYRHTDNKPKRKDF